MSHNPQPRPTRRRFFRMTGAVGLAYAAAPALTGLNRVFGAERKKGKLGVVLAGLGGFSNTTIGPEMSSAKNVYLAGVVTGDPGKKGKAWAAQYGFPEKNIYTYDTMGQMADNPEIDIVHVVTPNDLHAEHVIRAARAGKHVMCEKPMATSTAQCDAMIEACRAAGVQLGVDYRLLFEPHHMEMIRLATEKTYGAVKAITAEFSWRRGDNKPWLLDRKMAGGGALFDTGVYPVQAGSYITGESPIRCSATPTTTRAVYPAGVEETMSFILEYPGGAVMFGRASYAYSFHQFDVSAEAGTFSCTAAPAGGSVFGQSARGKPNSKQVVLPKNEILKREDTLALAVLHDEFAAAIREGRPFLCSGAMGRRDIRILEALYRSVSQGGKTVPIDI